jgi:hypothetical protein
MGVIPMLVFPVCRSVGLDNKLDKLHGTYIKKNSKNSMFILEVNSDYVPETLTYLPKVKLSLNMP